MAITRTPTHMLRKLPSPCCHMMRMYPSSSMLPCLPALIDLHTYQPPAHILHCCVCVPPVSAQVYIHVSVRDESEHVCFSTRTQHGGTGQPIAFMVEAGQRAPRAWEIAVKGELCMGDCIGHVHEKLLATHAWEIAVKGELATWLMAAPIFRTPAGTYHKRSRAVLNMSWQHGLQHPPPICPAVFAHRTYMLRRAIMQACAASRCLLSRSSPATHGIIQTAACLHPRAYPKARPCTLSCS